LEHVEFFISALLYLAKIDFVEFHDHAIQRVYEEISKTSDLIKFLILWKSDG